MFILNSFLLFDSNFFVTLQRHTLTQGMEYINCCNNMNQKPVSMISVDKMITRTDPVIDMISRLGYDYLESPTGKTFRK